MYQVRNINNGLRFTVYGVSGTRFLIYNEAAGGWMWLEMELFVPVEDD